METQKDKTHLRIVRKNSVVRVEQLHFSSTQALLKLLRNHRPCFPPQLGDPASTKNATHRSRHWYSSGPSHSQDIYILCQSTVGGSSKTQATSTHNYCCEKLHRCACSNTGESRPRSNGARPSVLRDRAALLLLPLSENCFLRTPDTCSYHTCWKLDHFRCMPMA